MLVFASAALSVLALCGVSSPLNHSPALFAHARALTDVSIVSNEDVVEVWTAEELKAAILAGESRIHFATTVTLTEELFPGAGIPSRAT